MKTKTNRVKAGCQQEPRSASSPRIFSGDASKELWAEISNAKTVKKLRMALYTVCCRVQELENKVESLSLPNAQAMASAETKTTPKETTL
jgi:hypothetical protein